MLNPSDLENLEPDLLKSLLEPLFEDFLHWFDRAQTILETESVEFLAADTQAKLLQNVTDAIQEVSAARLLFSATGGKAGVDTSVVMRWHQLVTQCWKVIIQAGKSQT